MDPETVHYLNVFLGFGAIILQIFSLLAVIFLIFGSKKNKFLEYIDKNFLVLGLIISLSASIFPLVYSEIVHFLPCYLCWWQRVFMFPIMFLFAVAYWDKPARNATQRDTGGDRKVIRYALPILCAGTLVSLYHNFFYYFGENSSLPCDASGVSCFQHLVSEFGGYISIPMLALSSFAALLALFAVAHFHNKK